MDIEALDPKIALEIGPRVISPVELELLKNIGLSVAESSLLGFSIKESFYKAVSDQVGRVLEFDEVEITSVSTAGEVHLRPVRFTGTAYGFGLFRWVTPQLLFTSFACPTGG